MSKTTRTVLKISLAIAATLCFGFQVYAVLLGTAIESSRPPRLFGNHARVTAALPDPSSPEKPFTFAVIGDTKGHGTFEALMRKVVAQRPDFVVLVGDVAMNPTPQEQRYVQSEMAEMVPKSLPVFFLPGNHDVDREGFTMGDFAEEYGDPFFTFTYRNTFFVFCPILPHLNEKSGPVRLEQLLRERPADVARTIVFLHVPPRLSNQYRVRRLKESKRVQSIIERHRVNRVFAGDFHGLYQIDRNGVRYIITGGGGAHLKYPETAGGFHHAVLVTISPEWTSERILAVDRSEEFSDRLEYLAGVRYYPICRDYPIAIGIGNLLAMALFALVARRLCHSQRS